MLLVLAILAGISHANLTYHLYDTCLIADIDEEYDGGCRRKQFLREDDLCRLDIVEFHHDLELVVYLENAKREGLGVSWSDFVTWDQLCTHNVCFV